MDLIYLGLLLVLFLGTLALAFGLDRLDRGP